MSDDGDDNVFDIEAEKKKRKRNTKESSTNFYTVIDGRHVFVKATANGTAEIPQCNFMARIIKQTCYDDGAQKQNRFLIEGCCSNHRKLPSVEVPAARLSAMNWVVENWGVDAVIAAGQSMRDRLREAISLHSANAQRETVYGHTGWKKLAGGWRFLHAGGASGHGGNDDSVKVDLQGHMSRYRLPEFLLGKPKLDAIRQSLCMANLSRNPQLGYLLLAATYRAPLGEACAIDHGVFIAGRTGAKKSEVAALCLAHYGEAFNARSFPANWFYVAVPVAGIRAFPLPVL